MIVEYMVSILTGWKGDSQNGWPEYRQEKVRGEVVGFVQRYEKDASAIVKRGGELKVLDVTELTVIEEG